MHNVHPRAPVCPDFLRGFCPKGEMCTMKHFTQRTLMEYYMRPQDYESMMLTAEHSWEMRCEPPSDTEDNMQPSLSQCVLDSSRDQSAPGRLPGSQEDNPSTPQATMEQDSVADPVDPADEGGVLYAAAEFVRLTAAHGGLHIGGILLPQQSS